MGQEWSVALCTLSNIKKYISLTWYVDLIMMYILYNGQIIVHRKKIPIKFQLTSFF